MFRQYTYGWEGGRVVGQKVWVIRTLHTQSTDKQLPKCVREITLRAMYAEIKTWIFLHICNSCLTFIQKMFFVFGYGILCIVCSMGRNKEYCITRATCNTQMFEQPTLAVHIHFYVEHILGWNFINSKLIFGEKQQRKQQHISKLS